MATPDYSNLINVGGEIRNTATNVNYSSPTQLAKDLGIQESQINWGAIQAPKLAAPTPTEPSPTTSFTGIQTAPIKTQATNIPATSLSQQITSGDFASVFDQNQRILQEQLKALQPSPERRLVAEDLNTAMQRRRDLVSEQVRREADLRLQSAEVGQPIVGRQLAALQREIGTRDLPLAQDVAALTDRLRLFEEEKQNVLQQLNILAESGRYNAGLAMKFNELARAEQQEARKLAREYGIESPFYIEGGTVYRTSDGKPYSSEEQFFSDPQVASRGIQDFGQAYASGLLSDLGPSIANRLASQKQQFEQNLALRKLGLEEDKFLWEMTVGDTQVVDFGGGNKALINSRTGELIRQLKPDEQLASPSTLSAGRDKVNDILGVISSPALSSLVGPVPITRSGIGALLSGQGGNFLGTLSSILSQLTIDKLNQAKQEGATFGALTDGEREMLAAAASKLNYLAVEDRSGKVVGYRISEKDFKAELDRIARYAKIDFVLKGGNPQDVGISVMPDGKLFTRNSDGTLRELDELYGRVPTVSGAQGFNSAGNALDSNVVKGVKVNADKIPLINFNNQLKPLTQAYPPNTYGGQCGVWVRSIVERQGLTYPRVGDTIGEKANTVSKYGVPANQAKIGSVVITNENKNTGHVAYIVGRNQQGWILAESNYGLDGRVRYGRVLPYNSNSIIGYLNPRQA